MSRPRNCKVCGVYHYNGGWGLCDTHLEQEQIKQYEAECAIEDAFATFMELPEEERWRKLWEKIQ